MSCIVIAVLLDWYTGKGMHHVVGFFSGRFFIYDAARTKSDCCVVTVRDGVFVSKARPKGGHQFSPRTIDRQDMQDSLGMSESCRLASLTGFDAGCFYEHGTKSSNVSGRT